MKGSLSPLTSLDAVNPSWEYRSYLIRLWRPEPGTPWRIMAQRVGSNTSRTFTDAKDLVAFLESDDHEDFLSN